jgi:chromate transporter
MHRELVERRGWVSEERFLHALNYCMLLPRPEAQQLAKYIGWLLHRVPGGIAAGAFFVIPSIFILLTLSYIYVAYGKVAAVAGVLAGFKPVVVAIIVEAVLEIGKRALTRRAHYLIAAAAFVGIHLFHIPFPLIVLTSELLGLALTRYWPDSESFKTKAEEHEPQIVVDDSAPIPEHMRPSRHGWLSQAEAIDGLAPAETTPGPLIMVLQFIGFMGGWNQP